MIKLLKAVGLSRFLPTSIDWITVQSANELMQKNQIILIDVRKELEWLSTGLPSGSNGIALQDPEFVNKVSSLSDLDKSKKIGITCLSGMRSKKAYKRLSNAGFKNLTCVEGGFVEWKKQNLPVENATL